MKVLGVEQLCTRTLNQDCLENMFGVIRELSEQNPRPSPTQFGAAFKTCLINNLLSNCNATNCEDDGSYVITGLLDLFSAPSTTSVT